MAKYTVTVDTEDGSFEVSKDGATVSDKVVNISVSGHKTEKWDGERYVYGDASRCYLTYTIIDSNGDEISRRVMFNDGKCTCHNISAELINKAQSLIFESEPKVK